MKMKTQLYRETDGDSDHCFGTIIAHLGSVHFPGEDDRATL